MTAPLHLDVESLRTYLAVLDHGGMTRAAEHLHLSQSAVSWKIKRLEQRVGRALLVRDGHALRPTRDGRALIDDARAIVELHDTAVCRLQSSDLSGNVRLGANLEVETPSVAELLGRFRLTHPAATVEFVVDTSEALEQGLSDGRLDVAVIQVATEHLRSDDVLLWTDELRWITSCEVPVAGDVVPLVTFGEGCFYRPTSEAILAAAGLDHRVAFSAPSSAGVVAAVQAGLGVAVIGSRYLGSDVVEWDAGAAFGPLPEVHQIARAAPGERSEATAALLDAIAGQLAEVPPPP